MAYPEDDAHGHWGPSLETGTVMLHEAGVEVVYIEDRFPDLPHIRRNGAPWAP